MGGAYPHSPHQQARSPALANSNPATPQMGQVPMANNLHPSQYGGYQHQQMGPQPVKPQSSFHSSSRKFTPRQSTNMKGPESQRQNQAPLFAGPLIPSFPSVPFDLDPASGHFQQFQQSLTRSKQVYGYPQMGYDYHGQQQQWNMQSMYQPQMPPYNMPPPSSPRPQYGAPQQQHYVPRQYEQPPQHSPQPQPQAMSRTSSQVSATDRPNSSVGQPVTPSMASVQAHSHRGSTSSPAPSGNFQLAAPSNNFQRPAKRSAGIVIKNPTTGAVVDLREAPASPARATPSPVKSGATPTPTPPPRTASHGEVSHQRTESKSTKSNEEKAKEMREAVARKVQEDAEAAKKEEAKKEEAVKQEAAKKEEAEKAAQKAQEEKEEAERKQQEAEETAAQKQKEAEALEAESVKKEEPKPEAPVEEKVSATVDEPVIKADKKTDDEIDFDAIEAEMARAEAEEAEREAKYQEKKQKEAEEKKRKEKEEEEAYIRNMKEAERKAEQAEEERLKKLEEKESEDQEKTDTLASLKNKEAPSTTSNESPAPETPAESGAATPSSDTSMPPPAGKPASAKKDKPIPLKLETQKSVEPPQPSAALQSLRSARHLDTLEGIQYPGSYVQPSPALNQNAPKGKFKYDKDFLLQFKSVFTEKPTEDWDAKIRDTVGDSSDSARPQSARTPSMLGPRNTSRPGIPAAFSMGSFVGQPSTRGPLPAGTTSEQRFAMSNQGANAPRPGMNNAFGSFTRPGGALPMGGQGMSRNNSNNPMAGPLPNSPRVGGTSHRGPSGAGGSKRGKGPNKNHDAQMPLTQNMDLKPIQVSASGWKPTSIGSAARAGPAPGGDGLMAPDMVQRKVKSHLNKMTPEKFDKIADQILEIAHQSKHEADGRTLRQVIQLTFEKATDEAHWAPMYAKFAKRMLESMSTDIKDEGIRGKDGEPVTGGALFRKYLLNRCQEEFERGWKVNLPEKPEGQSEEAAILSEEYYIAAAAKRRGLGLVKFIGELYKLQMLTERIMHECLKKLLDYQGTPEESEVESLTNLLKTVGRNLDTASPKGHQSMDAYFQRIEATMNIEGLHSRLRFMLLVSPLIVSFWKTTLLTIITGHCRSQEEGLAIEGRRQGS